MNFPGVFTAQRGSYLVDAQIHNDLALPYALDKVRPSSISPIYRRFC